MSEQNTLNLEETSIIDSVEKYKFEPIKGYPMLNWHGKRPFTSTQYYPAQIKEVYGEDTAGWLNKIIWGDNLQVMSHLLKEFRGKVNLVYIDPPFDSKADYKKKIELKGNILKGTTNSFEEKQYTDLWNNDEYLQFMYERFILIRELLSDSGSLFVHCDWHKAHHLRCILDEIFGDGGDGNSAGFKNEIIWHYKTGGASSKYWSRKHDNIYFYSKSKNYKYKNIKETSIVDKTKGYNPNTEHFIDDEGNTFVLTNPVDVWNVQHINAHDLTTRNGYPTQKPVALIEKIILAMTDEGDVVFDPFVGSGTTAEAAINTNRRFIVADINQGSIQVTSKRVLDAIGIKNTTPKQLEINGASYGYPGVEVVNVNNYELFRNPVEALELILDVLEVNRIQGSIYDGEKDGYMVKVMPINRIATREDLNDLISSFPYKIFESRKYKAPNKPVESVMLVCMGHEPDLKAHLEQECGYKIDVKVVDILRDKTDLEFKRDSEADIVCIDGQLEIKAFYPMNLMQKLSVQKETISEWKELVETVLIDWNYDGAALEPEVIDIPSKNEFVKGIYKIPATAGTIKVKITDVLSESYEEVIKHG